MENCACDRPGRSAALGRGNFERAGKVLRGEGIFRLEHVLQRSLGHQMAAAHPRAGTEIEDVIGLADRVLVMLDDDHGISQIAQPPQRADQPVVVALVQADARLVQHIQHTGQARTDLRRKPDALRLAAGERAAFPVEIRGNPSPLRPENQAAPESRA